MCISFARLVWLPLMAILPIASISNTCQAQPVASDPKSGRVFKEGSWRTPEEIAQANGHNKILEEYVSVRRQSPDTFEGHFKLARWCQARSLIDQRDAHLKRALMHNPENRRARGLLGHTNINGQWYTSQQIENHKKQIAAAYQRFRDWRLPIKKIAGQLRSRSERKRELGSEKLREITDPRSVTALEVILAQVNEPIALQAVEAINKFPEREATESIARIALLSPSGRVSGRALHLLASRNRYDYIPSLIRELVSPVSSRFVIMPDSGGNVFYQYVLFQQNMDQDVIRQFDLWMVQNPSNSGTAWQRDLTWEASRRAMIAESGIQRLNGFIDRKNCLIQYCLRRVTRANPGDLPEDWWRWWYDENEVYASDRPVSYTRVRETEVASTVQLPTLGECLVAGTPIWTEQGPKPVETLEVGDRVLCQDLESQELEYRTVLYPTRRPETPTFGIGLDGESIRASGGHLFWVAGQGWTKTRDLRAGMSLQTANGSAIEIKQIQSSVTLPLYNLVVDHHANYFVGSNKILSHDSTIPDRGERSVELTVSR